jgi:hypothetical protein
MRIWDQIPQSSSHVKARCLCVTSNLSTVGDRNRISRAYWPASVVKNLKLLRCPPLPSEPRHSAPKHPQMHIYADTTGTFHTHTYTHTHTHTQREREREREIINILAVMTSADDPWRPWRTPQNNVHIHIYTNLKGLSRCVKHSNQDSLLCSSSHRRSWIQAGQAIALYLFIRSFWCPWPDCCGHCSLHGEVNFCIHNRLLKSTGGNSLYEYQRTDKGAFLTAQALGVNVSPSQCTCPVNTALSCHPGQHLSQPTPEILVKLMSPTCQLSFHWTQSKRWDGIGHSELK